MARLEDERHRSEVPPLALLLSLLALWVPVAASWIRPSWAAGDVGILVWLLALIPPFLLSYYRGWRGASAALAGGMAAFTAAQLAVTTLGAPAPSTTVLLGAIVVLITVSLGSGVLATLFHRSLEAAERSALTDPGTGLPNRRHGMLHLRRAFAAANRGTTVSVVMFDLDKFKQVNDRFGHHTGDEVLRVFGEILQVHTRAMHLSVRFGGEEFMAILDGIDASGAAVMANRVLDSLREHDFSWGRLTVSAGISEYEEGMASPDVLIAAADQALYRAKARGGDRAVTLARQGSDSDAVIAPPTPSHEGQGSGELVLIVDDDDAVLRTLARSLQRRGYQTLEAGDPVRALRIVRELDRPLDLVITDLVMPAMSGFRLVEMLLDSQPDLRALYISGYSSDEIRWSGVPGAVKSFLPKPITLDALTAGVRAILDADTPRQEPRRPRTRPDQGRACRSDENDAVLRLRDRSPDGSPRPREAYDELMVRLAWAAEYRDDVTGHHAERVARLTTLLARRLDIEEDPASRIGQAALLHDVGKIAIPDAVLAKPGELTPDERELMERHCTVGARLLSGSRRPLLQEAERIARHHHERWDGRGYPDGLAGEEIPLSARITAVADAFDSMTAVRPYRPAFPPEKALARVQEERGSHFDPAVVDALTALCEERGFDPLHETGPHRERDRPPAGRARAG